MSNNQEIITIKEGTKDIFNTFDSTFSWCKNKMSNHIVVNFISEDTVEVELIHENSLTVLLSIMSEYMVRRCFSMITNNILDKTGVEIDINVKDLAFSMVVEMMSQFLESSKILLHWSLHKYFRDNKSINISVYEKFNLKPLQTDIENAMKQPMALNYLLDCVERMAGTIGTKDEKFLQAALLTKSEEEKGDIFQTEDGSISIWLYNGKLFFKTSNAQFGVRELLSKSLYENGFHPKNDMTLAKLVSLVVLFTGAIKINVYSSVKMDGIKNFITRYPLVFGNVEFTKIEKDVPTFFEVKK